MAVVEMQGLRQGVAALFTPRGLVFHDALRWRLFLVAHGQPPEKAFEFLREQGLLEGAALPDEAPRTSQMFLVAREEAPAGAFHFYGASRFVCSRCGNSCRGFNLGPLQPADAERLVQLDWSGTAHDTAHFFTDRAGAIVQPGAGGDLYLRREGDRCQFLRDDNLCEVHARFGAAAKPHMCRAFPLLLRASPAGVVAGLRLGECARADEADSGPPLAEGIEEIAALWEENAQVTLLPPLVWLAPGVLAPFGEWQEREQKLLDAPPAGDGISFLVRAIEAIAPLPPPCEASALSDLRAWLMAPSFGLEVAAAGGLNAAALALEERIARQALHNKDAFAEPTLFEGLALLCVASHLTRALALDFAGRAGEELAGPRQINDAAKRLTARPLREWLQRAGIRGSTMVSALQPQRRP